jgi:alanyl-tRNA synthetase
MKATMEKQKESKNQTDKARIQFDFSKESINKLDEIVETVNASTRAEVIRKALTLFTQILEADQRGAQFMFKEKDGSYVRILPLF